MWSKSLNVLLLLASSYICLLAVNIFIVDIYDKWVFDSRSRYEVVSALLADGIHAVPMTPPSSLIETNDLTFAGGKLVPLSGTSNSTTVYCNENGYTTQYESDRYGFNNPDTVWESQSLDIILIGDSFAQGACVRPEDDLAGNFRESGLSVLNLGMGGHGPLLELATLVEYANLTESKALIWLYCECNDLYFLQLENKYSYLANYLEAGFTADLYEKQSVIDDAWRTKIEQASIEFKNNTKSELELSDYLTLSNIRHLFKTISAAKRAKEKRHEVWVKNMDKSKLVEDLMTHLYYDSRASLPLFEQVISRAKNEVEKSGKDLYFVYLPSYERYHYSLETLQSEVLDIVDRQGIEIINFAEHMDSLDDPLSLFPSRNRGHFSPEGYRQLANYIEKNISFNE